MPLSIEGKHDRKMPAIQFLHLFHRRHEFWEIFNSQPLSVDIADRRPYHDRSLCRTHSACVLGIEPRAFMPRKRAAPSIADISSVSRKPVSARGVQESCLVAAAELVPRRLVFILLAVP